MGETWMNWGTEGGLPAKGSRMRMVLSCVLDGVG